MNRLPTSALLQTATRAARDAGNLLRREQHRPQRATETTQHDIKLELDVRCQKRISRALRKALPHATVLGEEGSEGPLDADLRWVVDPIDGTVNFAHGIPHACVAIALQHRHPDSPPRPCPPIYADGFSTLLGVVFDPFTDELWTATRTGPARLNGKTITVARRSRLAEAIVSVGFAKHRTSLDRMLPVFQNLVHRVRKIRIGGSAALALTYVASGRFDAYVESGVRLWDIAAGGLIVERAGGLFRPTALDNDHTYSLTATTPALARSLARCLPS